MRTKTNVQVIKTRPPKAVLGSNIIARKEVASPREKHQFLNENRPKNRESHPTNINIDNVEICYRNDFGLLLRHLKLNGHGVEVGVYRGDYAETIASFGLSKLYLVDQWSEYQTHKGVFSQKKSDAVYAYVVNKFLSQPDKIKIIRKDSIQASKDFEDHFFDFVYIDASHFYDDVCADLKAWYPKVKIGGIFAGHDYNTSRDSEYIKTVNGVGFAVDEFLRIHKLKLLLTKGTRRIPSSWYCLKH